MITAHEKREMQYSGRTDKRLSWISHGEKCSVGFWIQTADAASIYQPEIYKGQPCWSGGFEIHSRSGEGEPGRVNCSVLGGKCWHDGSSLSASEFFQTWNQEDESAFAECDSWVKSREGSE